MNKIIHFREQARVCTGLLSREVGAAEKDSEGNHRENTGIAGKGAVMTCSKTKEKANSQKWIMRTSCWPSD